MSYLDNSKILYKRAKRLGLKPKWLTSYGIFSIEVKNKEYYFFGSTTPLNTQINSYLSTNKHAAREILKKHKLPNIPYLLPKNLKSAKSFLKRHRLIVVKPVRGSMALGAKLIKNPGDFQNINLGISILEKFIKGKEIRTLVLNGKVISFHEKKSKSKIHAPPKVKRIAIDKSSWDKRLVKTAQLAAHALGLNFASVDFIIENSGDFYILEVNSSPAIWREHKPDEGKPIDVAEQIIKAVIKGI